MKLNVVELRPEMEGIPLVVAKPEDGKTKEEGIKEESFSFENFYYNGRVLLHRKKPTPFFFKYRSWHIKNAFLTKMRNQRQTQLERIVLGLEPNIIEKKIRSRPLK